jgi:hypothetical protein
MTPRQATRSGLIGITKTVKQKLSTTRNLSRSVIRWRHVNGITIFATPRNKEILSRYLIWMIDGTFKVKI